MPGAHTAAHYDQRPAPLLTSLILALVTATLLLASGMRGPDGAASRMAAPVPVALAYKPDFRAIPDPDARKARFFAYLGPTVQRINAELREQRERLLRLADQQRRDALTRADRRWLDALAAHYRVSADAPEARIAELTRRLDTLPPALVVAQAAIESGWGTSRFAREANNLFGEWCFERGCGLVPKRRSEDASHEVRWFPNVMESIRSYYHNLNSHPAYAELRARRARARASGHPPSALELAAGLEKYSERSEVYIHEVRTVIRANDLEDVYAVASQGA